MDNHKNIDEIGKRKNEELFSGIPENYFENLPIDIKNRISKTNVSKNTIFTKRPLFSWVIASITACFLVLIYFNVFFERNHNKKLEAQTYQEFLEEELARSIDINSELEILNIAEISIQKKEEKEIIFLDKIPVNELEKYLIEEDEDILLYN